METVLTSLNLHAAAARFHLCERQMGQEVFIHFVHMSAVVSLFITLYLNISLTLEIAESH